MACLGIRVRPGGLVVGRIGIRSPASGRRSSWRCSWASSACRWSWPGPPRRCWSWPSRRWAWRSSTPGWRWLPPTDGPRSRCWPLPSAAWPGPPRSWWGRRCSSMPPGRPPLRCCWRRRPPAALAVSSHPALQPWRALGAATGTGAGVLSMIGAALALGAGDAFWFPVALLVGGFAIWFPSGFRRPSGGGACGGGRLGRPGRLGRAGPVPRRGSGPVRGGLRGPARLVGLGPRPPRAGGRDRAVQRRRSDADVPGAGRGDGSPRSVAVRRAGGRESRDRQPRVCSSTSRWSPSSWSS